MFQMRIDYGVMTSCLVKPALYIVQKTSPRIKLADQNCSREDTESNTGNNKSEQAEAELGQAQN